MQQAATVASSAADTNSQPKQQQPWVHMQFPHMVMPHQMVAAVPPPPPPPQFPQHFMPFHPPHRAQFQAANTPAAAAAASSPASAPAANGGGGEDNKTIWVGDLHYWMDENYLANCFLYTGEVSFCLGPLGFIYFRRSSRVDVIVVVNFQSFVGE
jgi:hypothetical protein